VNLIGEHTDYNDGFVLPVAIDRVTLAAVRLREDTALRIWSDPFGHQQLAFDALVPGGVAGWAGYVAGALWATERAGAALSGADIVLTSDVPPGAGVSSSAAVECAVVLAAAELGGLSLPRAELSLLAHRAEFEFVGMPCGIMDQTVSMAAKAEHALFLDCRSRAIEHIPAGFAESGLELLVVDSRAPHRLVDGQYAERRAACESAATALGLLSLREADRELLRERGGVLDAVQLRRARHVITENERVLLAVEHLSCGRARQLGPLLNASHSSLREDFEVSVPELDLAQRVAIESGALGARLIGAGFGGSVLALVEVGDGERVAGAVRDQFAISDFSPPNHFLARVGGAACCVLRIDE
jgi:galactokinase